MIGEVYLLTLGVSVVGCSIVVAIAASHWSLPGAKPLTVMGVGQLWWVCLYMGELAAPTQWLTFTFARLQWLGPPVIPVAWLVFTLEYSGRRALLSRQRLVGVALIPALTGVAAMVAYDPWIRQDIQLAIVDEVSVLTGSIGVWLWVFELYTLICVAVGAAALLDLAFEDRSLYRPQAMALLAAVTVPLLFSISFAIGLWPVPEFDPTPVAFTLTAMFGLLAVLEFDLFDRMPVPSHVAFDTVVEAMGDPVFVLDSEGVVVDVNPAAASLVGRPREAILERPADAILPGSDLDHVDDEETTVRIACDGGERSFDVRRTRIDDSSHDFGEVLTFRDVTARHERQERLDALNDVLRATLQEEMETVQQVVDDSADQMTAAETLREHASIALDVSDRAAELSAIASLEDEPPADVVPIIHDEIDEARSLYSDVTFVLDATLDEWAYCSGLFEPVFRVALRNAAKRARATAGVPVVTVSVSIDERSDGDVSVTVSQEGPAPSDHERAVLTRGAEPRPADSEDIGRWLLNWGIRQCNGNVAIEHDGERTKLELSFPRTDAP